jgi:hypothetical protein
MIRWDNRLGSSPSSRKTAPNRAARGSNLIRSGRDLTSASRFAACGIVSFLPAPISKRTHGPCSRLHQFLEPDLESDLKLGSHPLHEMAKQEFENEINRGCRLLEEYSQPSKFCQKLMRPPSSGPHQLDLNHLKSAYFFGLRPGLPAAFGATAFGATALVAPALTAPAFAALALAALFAAAFFAARPPLRCEP